MVAYFSGSWQEHHSIGFSRSDIAPLATEF